MWGRGSASTASTASWATVASSTAVFRPTATGPIASPSASSLEAALNPAVTNHLYYVREPARNDGAHNFYDNEADFARGVQALRNWERERDARAAANRNTANANNSNATGF